MIHPWHDLSPGEKIPDEFHAVIEIPLGSNVNYELDKFSGLIKVDRLRPFTYNMTDRRLKA